MEPAREKRRAMIAGCERQMGMRRVSGKARWMENVRWAADGPSGSGTAQALGQTEREVSVVVDGLSPALLAGGR
jgi:hypothetical protein